MDEHIDMEGLIENNMPFIESTSERELTFNMVELFIKNDKERVIRWSLNAEFRDLDREITNLI
jgi:hypothetical protein